MAVTPSKKARVKSNSLSGLSKVTINWMHEMAKQEQDQEFIEYVVKMLVDRPEDVSSDRTVDEMGVLLTLKVNPQDLGQVIGRQGQTAKALRTLLRVVGAKHHARVNLKIYEPEGFHKGDRTNEPRTSADTGMDDLKL